MELCLGLDAVEHDLSRAAFEGAATVACPCLVRVRSRARARARARARVRVRARARARARARVASMPGSGP